MNGVQAAPGFVVGGVTGYASRTVYAWAGALYRRYMTPSGPATDHPGDQLLYSAVIGYRPAMFRKELPHADWRVFLEGVGELTARDRLKGEAVADSGGHQIFVGPTVLGLFGAWGLSGGPPFRVYGNVNGAQPEDRIRFVANYAHAVSVAFKRIDGVQKVDVSLAEGAVTLQLRPGNKVAVEQVRDVIRRMASLPRTPSSPSPGGSSNATGSQPCTSRASTRWCCWPVDRRKQFRSTART